jgi:hypothetical protein
LVVLAVVGLAGKSGAAEIKVLSAGAPQPAVADPPRGVAVMLGMPSGLSEVKQEGGKQIYEDVRLSSSGLGESVEIF